MSAARAASRSIKTLRPSRPARVLLAKRLTSPPAGGAPCSRDALRPSRPARPAEKNPMSQWPWHAPSSRFASQLSPDVVSLSRSRPNAFAFCLSSLGVRGATACVGSQCRWPHRVQRTGSLLNSEGIWRRARSVLGRGAAREVLWALSAFGCSSSLGLAEATRLLTSFARLSVRSGQPASGAAQRLACWARSPKVRGSKPCSTMAIRSLGLVRGTTSRPAF